MHKIDLLKENVNGVKGSFLIKNGGITECDLQEEKVSYLSKSIQFLTESFTEVNRNPRKISIFAEDLCYIFFHEQYILGTVVARTTNIPLLDMISHKLLFTAEDTPEKAQEAVDEVIQRMTSFIG
ncbi:MAG: hypothetical protein HXS41_06825 [Theionarchaea archaeon]|nr:hypothetical protein [Theionarchaea archaeon]MBU7000314.1 hypothetical protein [Theionarchaea archaeon]MBU7020755.1 hypothetical protein [Theionarchaea archaeon]MBU7034890.1 hypothetical protein [Theionarchaea archaeon]MBU7040113.1 hypothetical protein [Theionarchaea archaeon]